MPSCSSISCCRFTGIVSRPVEHFPCELITRCHGTPSLSAARNRGYERGTLAMANAGPDTNGSQFFICLEDVRLPPNYAVFGKVTAGMDVVDRIATEVPLRGEEPQQTVYVESVALAD